MAAEDESDDEREAREVVRDLVGPKSVRPRHDRFARLMFGDPREATGLLQAALPGQVSAAIDWSSLHLEPVTHIGDQLDEDIRDLVFSARWRGGGGVLLALLEHLSAPDPDAPRRVGAYLHGQWKDQRKQRPAGPLPMILPIVLYQGPPAWPGPRRFSEQVAIPPELAGLLAPFLPDFEPMFIELPGASADAIRRLAPTPAARIALALLADARTGADLFELLRTFGPELRELWARQDRRVVRVIVTYTMLVRPGIDGEKLMKVLEDTAGKKAGALVPGSIGQLVAEAQAQGRAEGKEEGRAEGKEEGRAEGKAEALELFLVRRFGPLPAQTHERVRRASAEALDLWLARALDAESLAAVFGA